MSAKKGWIVNIRCEIVKEVYCTNCTKEEAENDPWQFADDERELYQDNWEVMSVKEYE